MKKGIKASLRGFSMAEIMLAGFLLSVGLLGLLSLVSSSVQISMNNRDTIIATQLAQEGVEIVRNIKDTNQIQKLDDFANLPVNSYGITSPSSSQGCRANYDTDSIIYGVGNDCSASLDDKQLKLNAGEPTYYYHSALAADSPTKFKRKLVFLYDNATSLLASELTLTSMVTWGSTFPALSDCNVSTNCAYIQESFVKY